MRFVAKAYEKGAVRYVPGNHCNKLYRYLKGNPVKVMHGLETTAAELKELSPADRMEVSRQFIRLYESAPLYDILHSGDLVVAHAGIKADDIGKYSRKVKEFVLYGDITGETYPDGRPVRRDWYRLRRQGMDCLLYPGKTPRIVNRTINIDTGCVFGNQLTGFRFPEHETVSVESSMPYDASRFREDHGRQA